MEYLEYLVWNISNLVWNVWSITSLYRLCAEPIPKSEPKDFKFIFHFASNFGKTCEQAGVLIIDKFGIVKSAHCYIHPQKLTWTPKIGCQKESPFAGGHHFQVPAGCFRECK